MILCKTAKYFSESSVFLQCLFNSVVKSLLLYNMLFWM